MKRKKLAFVIPNLKVGGAERVVSTLSNLLISDFDIVIIVLYKCIPFYPLNSNIKIIYCLDTYNPNPGFISSIKTHYKLFFKILNTVKKENIQVVIGFMTTANIYTALVSKLTKAKSIINERAHPGLDAVNKFWKILRRITYPLANKLVLQTQEVGDYYKRFIKTSKIETITNPLAEELIHRKDATLKKEKIILNVGRLDDAKNQELLIKAFANIKNNGWQVQIAGDGYKKEYLQSLINSSGKQEEIVLLGNISDISKYYNAATIFVFTSNHEGFPNALIEAMYFGLACISTNCQFGPAELITDAENGFLIPINGQKELENKLAQLMQNVNLQEDFSKKAIQSVKQNQPDIVANTWKKLIDKL